jgi:hypothetical protein
LLFLKKYHTIFPLTRPEILFLKEAYRFFLLNYVVREGKNFFQASFARQLQHEAFTVHFQTIDQLFEADKLLRALDL